MISKYNTKMTHENIRDREPIRHNIKQDIYVMKYQADNIPSYDRNPK